MSDRASIVANDFLMRFIADREGDRFFELEHYLRLFPGDEEIVAREFQALHDNPDLNDDSQRLGHYVLESELGRGGQALVHRARDQRDGSLVALKTIRYDVDFDLADALLRLEREAKVLRELEHPGICPILDFGSDGSELYFAMPLIEGRTLSEELAQPQAEGQEKRQRRVVTWLRGIADSLQHAHDRGVLHRDVKPGNIMVQGSSAVLVDFGVARWTDDSATTLTQDGATIGTPSYMAPELLALEQATPRSDVFGLGMTLFHGLTGKHIFDDEEHSARLLAIARGRFDQAALEDANVHRSLIAILRTALHPDPRLRYRSAAALGEDLQRWLDDKRPSVISPKPLKSLWYAARRRPLVSALSIALSIAVLATVFLSTFLLERQDAVRAAEQARFRSMMDRELTAAYVDLWEGRPESAADRFRDLGAVDGGQQFRGEIELGTQGIEMPASASSQNESALQAFAKAHRFLLTPETEPSKGGAIAAAAIEAAGFLANERRLLYDVARVYVARRRGDAADAKRAQLAVSQRWLAHPSLRTWAAMAYETADPIESLRRYEEKNWELNSARRSLRSLLRKNEPQARVLLAERLESKIATLPASQRQSWERLREQLEEGDG